MELKEVLSRYPGLQRRFVYYLESQGYIHPARLPKARISRRDYTDDDFHTIGAMWRYSQRGYAVQAAYELLRQRQGAVSCITVRFPLRRGRQALERLRECPDLVEVCGVYASSADLLVRAETLEDADVYHTILPLLAEAGATGDPRVLRTRLRFRREAPHPAAGGRTMLAYILMTVPGKDVEAVMEEVKRFPEVVEASTVYGESDILLRVQAPHQDALDTLVMDRLHGIPQVTSTRTFIVVGKLHWVRGSP